jgi:MFS family permease
MDHKRYPPASLAWLVWGLGAAFYFIGFYHRVAPAVITNQLMADFNIGAAALGNLSAFYFYSYVLMQIPTGILADTWGPRKLLTAGALITAAGTLLFASAPSIVPANLGRLLIGGAVGVSYVATLRLAACWFDSRFYAALSGLALLCGVLGAVSAGVPLHFLVIRFGWRAVMLAAAALLFLTGAATWWIVRDDPSEKGYRSFAPSEIRAAVSAATLRRDLMAVFRCRNIRLLFLVGCGLTGPVVTFTGLWGVPYFTTHYAMSIPTASAITSTMLVCFAAGAMLLGLLSDRIGRRKPVILAGAITALLAWLPILLIPNLPFWLLISMVVTAGLSAGSSILCFAFVKESVPVRFAGTVSGVQNMGAMLGSMILPPAIGWALDLGWHGAMAGGVRIYDLAAYRSGFLLILAFSVLSVLLVGFTAETRCRQTGAPADEIA